MAASQELINAVIARIRNGEKIWEAIRAEEVSPEDRREVRQAAMRISFRNRLDILSLEELERREAMMISRLQTISEVIASKMESSSTS